MLWTYRKKNMAIRKIQANTNFLTEGVKIKDFTGPTLTVIWGIIFLGSKKKRIAQIAR